MRLFGFEIIRERDEDEVNQPTFAPRQEDDGAVVVAAGGAYGTILDLEGTAKSEAELVTKYRSMAMQSEVQDAVADIVNDSIVETEDGRIVDLILDDVDVPDSIKKKITDEFKEVLRLLDFKNIGSEIFSKWYVDGRLYYHAIIDESNVGEGIQELRYIDPRKIRKIREIEKKKATDGEYTVSETKNEYFLYNERGFAAANNQTQAVSAVENHKGVKIAVDSIVHCTSGVTDEKNSIVLSHLHKAIKPLNQLRMLEDAAVIYRLARAPERRIFYIDVGNLPKGKAEQYLRDMMARHKNKLVYDASTGDIKDARKHMTMLEDFWLPRREGGKGTEIDTLPGGANLGEMDDILYFQKRLYKSLGVPISRLEAESMFSFGRNGEITRDELKFARLIQRLRRRFAHLFNKCLEKQLILKNIISPEEWDDIAYHLTYRFAEDSYFEENKEAEILQQRVNNLRDINDHAGRYYSIEWIRKNVLMQTEEDIKEIDKQIEQEEKDGDYEGMDPLADNVDDGPRNNAVSTTTSRAAPAPEPKPEPKPAANNAANNSQQ